MRGRAGGEDIEDQLGAIEHLAIGQFLDVADLLGREIMIEDDRVGPGRFAQIAEFFNLALAHVGARLGAVLALFDLPDHHRARLGGQLAELAEGIALVVGGIRQAEGGQDGLLGLYFDAFTIFGGWHRPKVYAKARLNHALSR